MMEAFSNAREYWEVGLWVNASYLWIEGQLYSRIERENRTIPSKRDFDMTLINRKPQVQELELSVVAIQQIAASRAILPGPSHVLSQPVEG